MPVPPCGQFPCVEIYHVINIRIALISKDTPECPWPNDEDLLKVKSDLRTELQQTYPPFVNVPCPGHCHCEPYGKTVPGPVVKGEQVIRRLRKNDCSYHFILDWDVETHVQLGLCKEGGPVLNPGGVFEPGRS